MVLADERPNTFLGLGARGRDVLLVGHSLGGIIIKAWLSQLALKQDVRLAASRVDSFLSGLKAIVFIAVPHQGTKIAQAGRLLSCFRGGWSTTWLDLLGERGVEDRLARLATDFASLLERHPIPVLHIYETKVHNRCRPSLP